MPEKKKQYSVSLSELSKLYKIDKGVLKAIIKKVSKKSKKKKSKRAKAKAQSIKFDKKKEQEDNQVRYSYGPAPFPVKNNNSVIDIRDAQILSEKINDLKANNKLLLTDVLPNLVNNSDTKTLDLYYKMDNKVNTFAGGAKENFNFIFDNIGDWGSSDTRKLSNPIVIEQQKYESNPLTNKSNSNNFQESDDVYLDPHFYAEPSNILQQEPDENTQQESNQKEDSDQQQEPEPEPEPVDMFELDNVDTIKKDGFVPPKQKKEESDLQYRFRVKYYDDKFNNIETSNHTNTKYGREYKNYLKNKPLI